MSKSVINFKVDTEVKEEAQKLARELGVPLSSIVNAQLREFLRSRTLNVSAEPRMSAYLEKVIETVEKDRKLGRNITKTKGLEETLSHIDSL